MRPCTCDNAKKGNYSDDQCLDCWKWLNSQWWRDHWSRTKPSTPRKYTTDCELRGPPTGEVVMCGYCGSGNKELAVHSCPVHKRCITEASAKPNAPQWCRVCKEKVNMRWAYGITTVPERQDTTFERTLESIRRAGFVSPRLFVDGAPSGYEKYELDVTYRQPRIRAYMSWYLALAELYMRQHDAERYALFQDDFVMYRNLRAYLESCKYEPKTYWNLYTFQSNQMLAKGRKGWFKSNQMGKGAVALVFDNETVRTLLSHRHMIDRVQDPNRGWKAIDGGVVQALKMAGWTELVHNPSLVQHTGRQSTVGNHPHKDAPEWRGEHFDALELCL